MQKVYSSSRKKSLTNIMQEFKQSPFLTHTTHLHTYIFPLHLAADNALLSTHTNTQTHFKHSHKNMEHTPALLHGKCV